MSTDGTVLVQPRNGRESGVAIIVVMMFALVFLALGAALFVLARTSQSSTELERKEVKAFNVAEAGVDAGMLALKLHWPSSEAAAVTQATLDDLGTQVRTQLRDTNPGLHLPTRSDPLQFVAVRVYDNRVGADGPTTSIPDPEHALLWDSNGDRRMFVDSRANVDDDRHRIIALAEFISLPLGLGDFAMVATEAGAQNDDGLRIWPETTGTDSFYVSYQTVFGNGGIDLRPPSTNNLPMEDFDSIVSAQLLTTLSTIATDNGTFFTSGDPAETFICGPQASGSVVYVKSTTAIQLKIPTGATIGSISAPVVLVLDAPSAQFFTAGSIDFYGVIISLTDLDLKGSSVIHGAVLGKGSVIAEGGGGPTRPEIWYNPDVLAALNGQYPASVNMVPNTWEEYTIAPDAAY